MLKATSPENRPSRDLHLRVKESRWTYMFLYDGTVQSWPRMAARSIDFDPSAFTISFKPSTLRCSHCEWELISLSFLLKPNYFHDKFFPNILSIILPSLLTYTLMGFVCFYLQSGVQKWTCTYHAWIILLDSGVIKKVSVICYSQQTDMVN